MKYIVRYLSKRGMEDESFEIYDNFNDASCYFDSLKDEYGHNEEIGLYSTNLDVTNSEEGLEAYYSGDFEEIEEVIR